MPNYLAPGVYVQEMPNTGARAIGQVNTSIAGFIGVAPLDSVRVNEAVVIDNLTQFADLFIGDATEGSHLANAVKGFFDNGGSRCYVVNVGTGGSLTGTARKPAGLDLFEAIDDIAIVAAPGFADAESFAALQAHCEHPLRQDRVAILDTVERVDDISALTRAATSGVPETPVSAPEGAAGAVGAPAAEAGPAGRRAAQGADALGAPQSSYIAQYTPWIVVKDAVTGKRVTQPPSGHIAGVWARVDGERGVHKAPANEGIAGALDLSRRISRGEQEVLNPAGVNCIRYFPGEGIRIWGARTKDPGEFKYIPVRRLTNMIKESIEDGMRSVVFEPNDYTLWKSIGRDIRKFLNGVWSDGALVGQTQDEAFFVKCDAETNPPEVRDAGQVVTIIGIAPVKPAEFVIFKIMQSADTTETEGA